MALPNGITPKVVTVGIGSFFDGTLVEGTATITAPVNVVHVPSGSPIFSSAMTQRLIDGQATFSLCPTDHPDLNRVDWTYKLNVKITGALVQPDPVYFLLPVDGSDTIDLDSLVSVPSSAGTPVSVEALTAGDLPALMATVQADPDSQFSVDQKATFVAPSKIAAGTGIDPTGAADSTTALQAAINATPNGGRLYIPNGTYELSAALTISKSIYIEGESAQSTFVGDGVGGGSSETPASPFLRGVVLKQTASGADGLVLSGSGASVNLKNIGILFTQGTTGHGINATPTATFGTGHDLGLTDFRWENVLVYGHDGNHFGAYITNPQYGEVSHFRSYGGGGVCHVSDGNTHFFGNMVWTNPYVLLTNAGTAGGYVHSCPSGGPKSLNLVVYIRPQVNVQGAAVSSGQKMYDDLAGGGTPTHITVIAPDFENGGGGAQVVGGSGTRFVGDLFGMNTGWTSLGAGAWPYSATLGGTAIGQNALAANAGTQNTAVGGGALRLNTTGASNTAVGDAAAFNAVTANNLTAIGANALLAATGNSNTAIGSNSAKAVTSGTNNTAIGSGALSTATTGGSNTAIGLNAAFFLTGNNNTAVGSLAMNGATGLSSGSNNTGLGFSALNAVTSGSSNTAIGYQAGVTATAANATKAASNQTLIGQQAGQSSATPANSITAIGYQALAGGNNAVAIGSTTNANAAGAVAIGTDHTGAGATTTVQDAIALGTALHKVQISNNSTGAGSAALGANCPAITTSAPYTWIVALSGDGSTIYVPGWK